MRQSVFDFVGNLDTLIAVIIGAVLATSGALIAEVIQDRLGRARRERDAARFFGEIMTSTDQILDLAFHSHTIGEPWGRLTVRLYRTALQEASVYDRNRERLFEIRDMDLRFRIHGHVLRETFPITSLLDSCDQIDALTRQLDLDDDASPERVARINDNIANLQELRDGARDAVQEQHAKTKDIIVDLEKLAKAKFEVRYRDPP